MEEHRVKSAREIAMEKIARMADLTSEEAARQREKEFEPVGEAIARKYLSGAIKAVELVTELGRYRGAEARIVKRALLSVLDRSIGLDDVARSRRAMEGFQQLAGADVPFEGLRGEFDDISSGFEREVRERRKAFEAQDAERLRGLGISGSAVRPNVKENKDWQQQQDAIRQAYDLRLAKLRKGLM